MNRIPRCTAQWRSGGAKVLSVALAFWLVVQPGAATFAGAEVAEPPDAGVASPPDAEKPAEANSPQQQPQQEETPPSAAASPSAASPPSAANSMCLLIESAATAHGLPFEFFARLIWQESRFKPNALGPMTRNGRAQGIAQFMPSTASERGRFDPFDPVAALPKSAEFLEELHAQFGNLGLAAAAYNAGPRRVRDWLEGRGALPAETRQYVLTITGRTADDWAASRAGGDKGPMRHTSCAELVALLKEGPSPFVGELERRVREGGERPWGVELSAGFVRNQVLAAYASIEKTYRTILDNRDPVIIENKFRSRGTRNFYQVRVGADTRTIANALCATLRKAGAACLVLRNNHGAASPL